MGKVSLRDVVVTRAPVYVTEEDYFEVRGVSLADIIRLFNKYTAEMLELFDDFMAAREANGGEISTGFVATFLQNAMIKAPDIVFELIVMASEDDDPQARANVENLRFGVQVEALNQIMLLSISSEAELKKLVEVATKAITFVTGLVLRLRKNMNQPSGFRFPDGFGDSANGSTNS